MISCLSFIMHFIHLDLGFWFFFFFFFWKFLGFFKIVELFVKFLGWVLFKWSYMIMHCITFAFSQCFMQYRCVISLLEPCVLVGLDWVEPMIFLQLHVTCSCIFHAYVPFFSFFLILLLIGNFLLLSLSLFGKSVHGTQAQIHSIREPSLFRGIFFFWSYTLSCPVSWW